MPARNMTRALAQLQSKAGDQWSYFQPRNSAARSSTTRLICCKPRGIARARRRGTGKTGSALDTATLPPFRRANARLTLPTWSQSEIRARKQVETSRPETENHRTSEQVETSALAPLARRQGQRPRLSAGDQPVESSHRQIGKI